MKRLDRKATALRTESTEEWGEPPEKLTCRKVEKADLLKQVVLVDQSPIGRTPRSNPVTYIKAFDHHPRAVRVHAGSRQARLHRRPFFVQHSRAAAAKPARATAP